MECTILSIHLEKLFFFSFSVSRHLRLLSSLFLLNEGSASFSTSPEYDDVGRKLKLILYSEQVCINELEKNRCLPVSLKVPA